MQGLFACAAIGLIAFFAASCGSYTPKDSEAPPPGDVKDDFGEIKPVIDAECGRCHNGNVHPLIFSNSATLRKSNALSRVQSGTMPPDKALAADTKAKIIAFIKK